MRLKDLLEARKPLTEMIAAFSNTNDINGATIVAYKDKFWVFGDDQTEVPGQVFSQMMTAIGINHSPDDFQDEHMSGDDVRGEMEGLLGSRPDVIIGTAADGKLWIDSIQVKHHPIHSMQVKKLTKALGLSGAGLLGLGDDGSVERDYDAREMTGKLPERLMHGTSSKYAMNIIRTGLIPGKVHNWANSGIRHDGIVFGATEMSTTVFHASRTTYGDNGTPDYAEPDEDFPVIIRFRVPDQNKLVPDFDNWNEVGGNAGSVDHLYRALNAKRSHGYGAVSNAEVHSPELVKRDKHGNLWKASGIYGYNGRIPPSHIEAIGTWWDQFASGSKTQDEWGISTGGGQPEWYSPRGFLQEWEERQNRHQDAWDEEENEDDPFFS